MKLSIFLVLIYTQSSYAQFFDSEGLFSEEVFHPPSNQIGWSLADENSNTTFNSNVVIGYSSNPRDFFCSGTIFKPNKRSVLKNALVVTNGHCTPYLSDFVENSQRQYFNENVPEEWGAFGAVLNNFANSLNEREHLLVSRVLYASMFKRDIAILEIDASYDELSKKYGLNPSKLSANRPKVDETIFTVGTPMASMPLEAFYHHISYCKNLGDVELVEGPIRTEIAIHNF